MLTISFVVVSSTVRPSTVGCPTTQRCCSLHGCTSHPRGLQLISLFLPPPPVLLAPLLCWPIWPRPTAGGGVPEQIAEHLKNPKPTKALFISLGGVLSQADPDPSTTLSPSFAAIIEAASGEEAVYYFMGRVAQILKFHDFIGCLGLAPNGIKIGIGCGA